MARKQENKWTSLTALNLYINSWIETINKSFIRVIYMEINGPHPISLFSEQNLQKATQQKKTKMH